MARKAISPLIATVLLLGLTVIIGLLVMSFGRNWLAGLIQTTEETTSKGLACVNEGGMRISACINGADTSVTITNSGKVPFTDYIVSACSTTTCQSEPNGGSLAVGASEIFTAVGISDLVRLTSSFTISSSAGTIVCEGQTLTGANAC